MSTIISNPSKIPVDNVVLLAGAGSSCHLGLPTLEDLLRRATLGNDDVADRIRRIRASIEALPTRFRPAVFEELIARTQDYLRTTYMIRTDPTYRREMGQPPYEVDNGALEWKWKQALTRCYRVLLDEYGPARIDYRSESFSVTIDLLEALAKHNNGELHVYTTNYDCSFQVLASHCQTLEFLTHIDNVKGTFSDAWYSGKPEPSIHVPRVYIHRLHGCIAWFNVSDPMAGGSMIREVHGAGGILEIVDDDFLHQMCIKLISDQLVGTNPAFSSAFDEFSNHLRKTAMLFVWGYSFRDLEVITAINHAFSERSSPLPIIYLDPFLKEETARDRIQYTLLKRPVPPSVHFNPRPIDWAAPDGLNNLVSKTMNGINTYR